MPTPPYIEWRKNITQEGVVSLMVVHFRELDEWLALGVASGLERQSARIRGWAR
jgi:hypothetical protein